MAPDLNTTCREFFDLIVSLKILSEIYSVPTHKMCFTLISKKTIWEV